MDIYLSVQNLIDDIGSKYLMELQTEEPIPPRGTIIQSLNEAHGRLTAACTRWLSPMIEQSTADDLAVSEQYMFPFVMTSRRSASKAQPLADLMHSYLVNAALAKVFSSMAQTELAGKHDTQTASDLVSIEQLLYSKLPPL